MPPEERHSLDRHLRMSPLLGTASPRCRRNCAAARAGTGCAAKRSLGRASTPWRIATQPTIGVSR
jgi:hypothetical protein